MPEALKRTAAMATLDFEARFALTGDEGAFSGYACVFNEPNSFGEVVKRGAFRKTLREHATRKTRPGLFWMHDPTAPIGVWSELVEDETGLQASGKLVLETGRGREAHALLKAKALDGLSIGFRARSSERGPNGVRVLTDIELLEISLVSLPAASKARVTTVHSLQFGRAGSAAATFVTACREAARSLQGKDLTMRHTAPIELRSAVRIETRAEGDEDPFVVATQAVAELRTAVEQHQTRTDERLTTEIRQLGQRIDTIEARSQRLGGGGGTENQDEGAALEQRAFFGFVRRGTEALQADEVRALRVSTEEAGGFLAPEQFVAEIIRNLVEVSPVRQAARVGEASAGTVVIPKRTGRLTAQWVGETEDRPETQPAYGQARIEMHEIACYVDVSNWLLEDAAVDLAAELSFDFAEEFGRKEGEAFINGDGVKKPYGIMSDPAVPEVVSGHATLITADSLITLMYNLPAYYRNRGSWLINSSAIAAIRLFKDTTGQYIWQNGLQAGQPPTLLGRPVIEAVDMPDVAANARPIAFGDFATAYRIYDRVNLAVLRDPYTMATKGLVRFHARRRVGGAVVQPEAIRKLKIAAA